jgi:hypothetical protein
MEKVLNKNVFSIFKRGKALKKTPLFEFEIPTYKKRHVGITDSPSHKQTR